MPRQTRRLTWFMRCGVALCAVIVAAAVGEIVVRLFGTVPILQRIRLDVAESAYQYCDNPILGYELKMGYRSANPDLHESFPSTNSHGQRDIERSTEKQTGHPRILMLGDSVVACHGIYDVRDTIPLQLQARLAAQSTEVLNFGVGGYCTHGEVELLRAKGLAFRPDMVILVFVSNDYADLNSQVSHYHKQRPSWTEWLFVHSQLFRLAALRLDLYRFRTAADPDEQQRVNSEAIGMNNVERGLPLLKHLAVESRFQCLIVIWPTFSDNQIVDLDRDLQPTSESLYVEQIAARAGLPTFRLSKYFRADWLRRCSEAGQIISPRQLYTIGDGMHPSPDGAAVAAEAIAEILADK